MKKTTEVLSYILFLCLLFNGCKGSRLIASSNQIDYTYSAESFGYSDIKKIYSSDTVNAKKPFFKSASLQLVELVVKSDISKTVLKRSAEGILFSYQLLNPSIVLKSGGVITNSEVTQKELMKPVFVLTDYNGKVTFIRMDSSMTDMASGIFKGIISRMQFVKSEKKSERWQTSEENTNGTYTANYHIAVSNAIGNTYNKEIVKYLKYKSKRKNQHISTDNNTTIETDIYDAVKTMNTSEAQILIYNNDTISVSGTKVYVFKIPKSTRQKYTRALLLDLLKSKKYRNQTTLSEGLSGKKITEMAYSGTLNSDNWQQLVQRLSNVNSLTKAELDDLVLKFRAIFYLHSDTCDKAVTMLEKEPHTSSIFKLLIKALSMAETSAATDALCEIIENNRNNEEVLIELLPELTTTAFPTLKAVKVVKSIAFGTENSQDDFTTSTAQLALGGMANSLKQIDTLQAVNLTKYLIKEMRFEKDTIQKLLVFGNTGSIDVFHFSKTLIEDPQVSDQVKIEAISALSLIADEQVSVYLKKLLQNKNVAIQEKTKEVLEFRNAIFNLNQTNKL